MFLVKQRRFAASGASRHRHLHRMAGVPKQIDGVVERVTYHNDVDGFSVLRFRPRGGNGALVTVVGHLGMISEGERLLAEGDWREDPPHRRQVVGPPLKTL